MEKSSSRMETDWQAETSWIEKEENKDGRKNEGVGKARGGGLRRIAVASRVRNHSCFSLPEEEEAAAEEEEEVAEAVVDAVAAAVGVVAAGTSVCFPATCFAACTPAFILLMFLLACSLSILMASFACVFEISLACILSCLYLAASSFVVTHPA